MSLDDCRAALRSDEQIVAVEAAAGCGKTFEAVALAAALAERLKEHQEVLLLAHTHAAINVFRSRVPQRSRVRIMTLDAFALEIVEPYAVALGLPAPLRVGRKDGLPFARLAPSALALVRRSTAVRHALSQHYPFVLLDEHQDARTPQHELAMELARAGSRLRFFGDPMQGIFDFGEDAAAEWHTVVKDADQVRALVTPRRWPGAPRLGEWLTSAREALRGSDGLPRLVPEVHLETFDEEEPPPQSTRAPALMSKRLFRLLGELQGSVALIVRNRAHAVGLRRALARSVSVFEGRSAADRAGALLDEALPHRGDGLALARLAVDALGRVSAGMNKALREQIARCLSVHGVDRRKQKKLLPTLDFLAEIFEEPTAARWCSVIGKLASAPPPDVALDDAGALFILGRLQATSDDGLHDALAEMSQRIPHRRPRGRCIITVHMAKGDEFDHVIVPHFGRGSFPDTPSGRRLLYVAITRACRSLFLMVPRQGGSPLAPRPA